MAQKRSRRFTIKDVQFVHKNYSEMTAAEIASAKKLSLFQINKIVSDLRKSGIDMPRKTPKRVNPVKAYIQSIGSTETPKTKTKAKKRGRKPSA